MCVHKLDGYAAKQSFSVADILCAECVIAGSFNSSMIQLYTLTSVPAVGLVISIRSLLIVSVK